MGSRTMAVTLSAFVAGGAIAGHGASGPEQESPHAKIRVLGPAPCDGPPPVVVQVPERIR